MIPHELPSLPKGYNWRLGEMNAERDRIKMMLLENDLCIDSAELYESDSMEEVSNKILKLYDDNFRR